MVRKGDWSNGVKPEYPLTRVARRALTDRFATVRRYMPLAAERPDEDPEHVHQLRVATRRALAAIDLFADLLPVRRARAIRKDLKRLRRAAGDARDLDVLVQRLREESQPGTDCQPVIARVLAQRLEAQGPIVKVRAKLQRSRLCRRLRELKRRTRWRCRSAEPSYGAAARAALCPVITTFFSAATADLSDVAALHTMRIQGKKLRYAMELLGVAFDPRRREDLQTSFKQIQDRLGEINDLTTAKSLFTTWRDRDLEPEQKGLLDEWIGKAECNLQERCQQFRQWWTPQRAHDLRRQFDQMLAPPGR